MSTLKNTALAINICMLFTIKWILKHSILYIKLNKQLYFNEKKLHKYRLCNKRTA